ncbi:long-chain fatty acid--CoA ligase [Rhodobacteraceae bacterium RKSG542]|uniref:long-chain-fatty-acid--CoA ligase n=1 Tax=Pseudovibrio flavus TaxID=2529854 RepID=UPI0012BD6EBB|nr:long-chain fatty acid--CoA ligase [Pseudovibrio flavus]MTI19220.1 long-chain fatty acid--CoA ligase [Pseudovibrio flavus]
MTSADEWAANFKARPLGEYLDDTLRVYSERPATDFLGKTTTYAELGDMVDRIAAGLQAMGVKKDDKVGICLPNCPYYPAFYYAILNLGATVVNVNPLYVEREMSFQVRDSGAKIMVTLDLKVIYDKIEAVRKEGALEKVIVCPMADILPQPKKLLFTLFKGKERAKIPSDTNHVTYSQLTANAGKYERAQIDPYEQIAVLQYTGGTTGVPKGAMLTHANLSANMEQMREAFITAKPGVERMMCVLPFFHVFAMTVCQNLSVLIGAEMLLMPRFEMKMFLDLATRKKATLCAGVPTIYNAINNSPETKKYDLSSIKLCMSGGAPLPVEVKQEFEALTGCFLVEGYGLSESSPVACANPLDGTARDGSIGLPVAGTKIEFRDLEDPTKQVPKGEKGEVCIIGPQVMKGYWQRPDESEKTLINGSILRTGDVGYEDADGFIYLVDRIKDLIICSGYNVYPRVIEEALYQHPAVEETIVIAVPDDYRGQAPKAFVKLREGENVSSDDLMGFLKSHISKIEMPKEIVFREELPKTLVGKLSKKELVEEEAEKRKAEEAATA